MSDSRRDVLPTCGRQLRHLEGQKECFNVKGYIGILTDEPVRTAHEVFRRCEAAKALAGLGPAAEAAMPALIRTLVVAVSVDCVLALRVATAEALWRVGGRHDLALPFLAWALKDEDWGVSRDAAQILGEMGSLAHDTVPDLAQLAARRCAQGPFHFEKFDPPASGEFVPGSLLGVVATALGRCGRGTAHWQEAHTMLTRLMDSTEADTRTAATRALDMLGTLDV